MKIGCCVGIDHYELARQCGYEQICLPGVEVASMKDNRFEKTREIIQNGSLVCDTLNAYCGPDIKLDGPEFDPDAVIGYAKKLMSRSAQLGIRYVGVGSPLSRNIPEGFSRELALQQLGTSLREMCKIAARYSMTVLMESVCDAECNMITTTEEAYALIRHLGLPNLELVYDIYHTGKMGEDLSWIEKTASHIKAVHIARDIQDQRHYLCEEEIPLYRPYIEALRKSGYKGCVYVEAFCGDVKTSLPATMDILTKLIRQAANTPLY